MKMFASGKSLVDQVATFVPFSRVPSMLLILVILVLASVACGETGLKEEVAKRL